MFCLTLSCWCSDRVEKMSPFNTFALCVWFFLFDAAFPVCLTRSISFSSIVLLWICCYHFYKIHLLGCRCLFFFCHAKYRYCRYCHHALAYKSWRIVTVVSNSIHQTTTKKRTNTIWNCDAKLTRQWIETKESSKFNSIFSQLEGSFQAFDMVESTFSLAHYPASSINPDKSGKQTIRDLVVHDGKKSINNTLPNVHAVGTYKNHDFVAPFIRGFMHIISNSNLQSKLME